MTAVWPETADQMAAFAARLEYTDDHVMLPPPPGRDGVMVSRSLKMPASLDQRIKAAAARHGVTQSTLMRQLIETELAVLENDRPISLADALRALANLRKPA